MRLVLILFFLVFIFSDSINALNLDTKKVNEAINQIENRFNADFLNLSDNFEYITIIKAPDDPETTFVIFSNKEPVTKDESKIFEGPLIYFMYDTRYPNLKGVFVSGFLATQSIEFAFNSQTTLTLKTEDILR
jgi:hypothetical protein